MAVRGTFPIRVESNLRGLGLVLKSAVCEWLLMFLLLLDAAFSYFLTKFAQYCELQLPCLLCSRLDHVFGKEKPDFFKNLLCDDHKLEITSLVLCHDHAKLASIHGMCEDCLLSFARSEASEETYKHLVGKLGPDSLQKPFLSLDTDPGSFESRSCSCCSKPWRTRPQLQKIVRSRSSASMSKPDIPLPKSPRNRCLNRQEGLKKRKDRFSVSTTPLVLGGMEYDILSHTGYTEVKITSDSDSDLPVSDEDDFITVSGNRQTCKKDNIFQLSPELLPKKQNDVFPPASQIHKSPHTTSILMHPDLEPEKGETTTPKFFAPSRKVRHSLSEINWQQINKKTNPGLPEFTSLDDIPLSSNVREISAVISTNDVGRSSLSKMFSGSDLADSTHKTASMLRNITYRTASPSVNVQFPINQSTENRLDAKINCDIGQASAANNWESIDLNSTTAAVEVATDPKGAVVMASNYSDRDPRDLASCSSNEVKTPGSISEYQTRDCNGAGPSENLSVSKSSAPYSDSSFDKIPGVNGQCLDEPQTTEAAGSVESLISKPNSFERSHSLESQEGSVGEIEGENIVDRLRQDVDHGKRRINDLYKELEEERNAAAISANQAMAMITKLQEEKAALHMEALQYLRMMEEQAEYDVDELEKANDMLAEKEKEIQDLQAELDYYRMKFPEEFMEDSDIMGLDPEDVENSYTETVQLEHS